MGKKGWSLFCLGVHSLLLEVRRDDWGRVEVGEMRKACRRILARWKKGLKEWFCSTAVIKDGMFLSLLQGIESQEWPCWDTGFEASRSRIRECRANPQSVTEVEKSYIFI